LYAETAKQYCCPATAVVKLYDVLFPTSMRCEEPT
jgi:hypothetical protein